MPGVSSTDASGEALGRLHADEGLHRFPEQVSLVHTGIGNGQRLPVDLVVEGNGGSHRRGHLK
jgi:hypothetical protein